MLDKLRDKVATYLAGQRVCVLSTTGPEGVRSMLAYYRPHGLEVDCLLPRWADVTYHLEQDPRVALVIPAAPASGRRWLQCLGTAAPLTHPDWTGLLPDVPFALPPDDLYLVVRVTPLRIDLMDETQGWGARETLELT